MERQYKCTVSESGMHCEKIDTHENRSYTDVLNDCMDTCIDRELDDQNTRNEIYNSCRKYADEYTKR